jgi:hypothetical protein
MARRPKKKARVIPMRPNQGRIVEAILFIIQDATERRMFVTQYDIVKSLFLADRAHLNKYGRPITFDNYVAMEHGPVPSTAYNFLKEDGRVIRKYPDVLPWSRAKAPDLGKSCFRYWAPKRAPNEDILSPSDFDELRSALTIVKALGFGQVRRLTHEDQAYVDAWEGEDGGHRQYPMSYALLFDVPAEDKAEDLAFLSKHI